MSLSVAVVVTRTMTRTRQETPVRSALRFHGGDGIHGILDGFPQLFQDALEEGETVATREGPRSRFSDQPSGYRQLITECTAHVLLPLREEGIQTREGSELGEVQCLRQGVVETRTKRNSMKSNEFLTSRSDSPHRNVNTKKVNEY